MSNKLSNNNNKNNNKPICRTAFALYARGQKSFFFSVRIVAEESFDSFILQFRGKRDDTGNLTYPGKWIQIPHVSKMINCKKYRGAAVIDRGKFII